MAQNICNICGANYEYKNGRWVCPACGAYKPEELSNEEVTLLYNASQKIRLALFDDAEEQYKDIVSKFPDNPDGYWGLVLAKYGIKYEQDYDGKMIPSCYAASYESVLTDKNYLKAVELADKDNKKYYEEQANKIEKIRKEWIDKASKEEPYDIFISYKDTEKENGTERTKDSYDALELYTMLSKLGYRVFYSRESLKDKTGEKYEPYIFNALNTAHIMIVYGSKPEYIESTWIKNEWMRFYKRIKLGKKQPNALLVVYNGFNPSELPSPLSKMQNLDRSRIDFSREIESYCKRVIKAATTVLPKIERVEVKAKQGKVGKIVKIEAVELNSRTAQKAEIVREEVEKREIGNYTVSKLTANAENELKIAEMQLSTANFDEAGKRFNVFLLKNPKNGRALTGKLLAENKSKDLDGFSSSGVQSFADWKLLEQVLLFSEKSISGKILKSLCDEILRSFNTGDYVRAKDVYSQVSAYEDNAVTEMRKSVCDLAKGLIGKNDDTAKYFIDGYLLYEQDEDKFLSQIKNVVKASIEKSDFNFAKKYSEDWLKYENFDLSANYSALKIKYKVKTLTELFTKTESNNAYSEIDDILHCLNEESAAACFKDICDRVNTLLSAGNSAKQIYAYIDKFFRYIFDGRSEKIKQFLTFITNKPSKEFTSVFDLLLSLSDFNTEEYSIYTLRFADAALKNGDFDLADKYYDKVNELHETALSWEGKLKCRLEVKNDIEYSANIQNLTDFKIIENILSLSENDGKRYEFLNRLVGYVYSALKTSKTDTAKLVAVFESLLAYVPKDFDDKIIEWLFKFARFLKNNDEFDLAEKLYAIIVNYDAENHVAYWEILQAKLRCKDENSVIKQYNLISDFQEFQNALLASANNDSALRHYIDIQNKQKAWIEQDKLNKIKAKKRKKVFKVACIMLAVIIIAIAGVFGGLSYYNSENILKYNSVDGGLSVYAGKFYKAEETLIIPQAVDGKTVIEIGANAFENHTEIKKVIIPTTVNAIRESAFSGCVNLESVEFSNIAETSANTQTSANENNGISLFSAQTFNTVSFATANTTESINLSVIEAKAFKGCEKLQTFELNYGLKTIGEEAFSGSGLKEIAIPETVEYVGKNVFENCNSLTVIEVGDRDEIPQNWDTDWNKGQEVKVEFSVRVVFDYNGADRTIKAEQYVVYEKSYNFPVPTKEGYMFVGWYRGETKLTGKDGVSLSDWNYTDGGSVKAEFTANENTLFFNGNGATGGDMQSQKIHTADNVNLNANGFTRAGYTFTGWSTSANGTKVYNDGALYTMGKNSSYVLYAVWQANTNVLHFNANGGSGTVSDMSITTDFTVTLYSNYFTRNGYTFQGWATSPNGDKVYSDNASYTMGTNSEYTLFAVWEINIYTIDYYLNDGAVSGNPITYTVEDEFTLINPTKTGYSFNGWNGTNTNGHKMTVTINKGSVGNRFYYAEWNANVNVLHFNSNGGSGTMSDRYIQTDETKALFANEFVRNGYDFVGWATEPNGTKVYNDKASYTMGTDSEYTLYALWSIKTFSITYNLNNGSVDSANPTEFTVETDTFTLNNPKRVGYTFIGWSGSGITGIIDGNSLITVTIEKGSTFDRSYTANWEANINALHFNPNGGSGEMDDMLIATDSTVSLSANTFARKGYTFVGWSTIANGQVEYNNTANYTMGTNSEYTLYALWSISTYTIECTLNGGSASNTASYTVESVTFTLNNPTKAGYTFTGWSGTDINGQSMIVTIEKGSIGDREYTANWQANLNVIVFHTNDENNTINTQQVYTDQTVKLNAVNVRDNYAFEGWSETDGGEVVYADNVSYTAGTNAENHLYAVWYSKIVCDLDSMTNSYILRGLTDTTVSHADIQPTYNGKNITAIANNAFSQCTALQSVSLPKHITTIAPNAFVGCLNLNTITVEQDNTTYHSENNCLIATSSKELLVYCTNSSIPDNGSVTNISEYAFKNCKTVKEIIIPNMVTDLPKGLLSGCSYLESLTIPYVGQGIDTDQQTGEKCFGYIFGEYQFEKSQAVEQFYSGTNKKTYYIPKSLKKVTVLGGEGNLQYGCMSQSTSTFVNCSMIEEIVLPSSLTIIPSWTFGHCSGLKTIDLRNIIEIKNNAFSDCVSLESVELASNQSVVLGYQAFNNCSNLKKVIAPKGYPLEPYCFRDCSKLEKITLTSGEWSWNGFTGSALYGEGGGIGALFSLESYDNSIAITQITKYVGSPSGNTTTHVFYVPASLKVIEFLGDEITNLTFSGFSVTNIETLKISNALSNIYSDCFNYLPLTTTIVYDGTLSEWATVMSNVSWCPCVVQCNDGTLSANGRYSISLNANTGYIAEKEEDVYYNNTYTLPIPVKSGYTFMGWFDSVSDSANQYTDSTGESIAKWLELDDSILYAHWQANLNVVMLKDGTNTVQTTGYTDDYARLPENTFVKENYEFKGWATTQGGDVAYYDRDFYPVGPNSSYTLYAVWEEMVIIDRTGWTPISTIEELNNIRNNLNGRYYLTCDLDMYGYEWTPIGYFENTKYNSNVTDKAFRGIFDGNGFVIYNLSPKESITQKTVMSSFDSSYYTRYLGCGLFGYNAGTLKNICIYNINIDLNLNKVNNGYTYREYIYCGGVCSVNNGSIIDCYVQGNINFLSNLTMLKEGDSIPLHERYLYSVNLSGICGQPNESVVNCFSDISIISNVNSTMGYVVPDTENIKSLNAENLSPWNEWHIRYKSENGTYRYQFAKWHSIINAIDAFETKAGYTFIGWSLSDGGAVKYHAGDECFIPLDKTSLTLYPVWQANTNEVIFNANGGSGTMANQQIQTDATAKLSANVFTKTGYHFIGWSMSPDGQVEFTDKVDYTMGVNSLYTLYAVWEQNTNEIIFNANGGSGTMANQEGLTNSTVTLNQCTFTAPMGYYFAGWSEDPNGDADYSDCSEFSIGTNANYTIYAIWKEI